MEGLLQYGQAAWQPGRTSTGPAEYPSNGLMSKTQASSPFKGGEPVVHHERAARALERLGILCYDVAKPMKECGCQETVFTNSLVGTKTGGRPSSGLGTWRISTGQSALKPLKLWRKAWKMR